MLAKPETRFEGINKTSEEWSNYIEMYNPMDTGKVTEMLSTVDFRTVLCNLFGKAPETIVVTEPRFFENFAKVFNAENLELYKHWAYVTGLLSGCNYLSEELRDMGGMYMRALTAVAKMQSIEKFAYHLASGKYADPVGIYYGEKYFGEKAKKDITEIVYQIIDTYKTRIKTNDILGEASKEKAILKLSKMGVKMGVMMNTMMDNTSSHIADMMIQGATMGITDTTKLVRENENSPCSEEALALARRIIKYEEESIERLKEFL